MHTIVVVWCAVLRSQRETASTIGAAAFHYPVRDGAGWVHGATRTPLVQGQYIALQTIIIADHSRQVFLQGSPRPCAPVTCTPRDACSAGRLPSRLLGD